MKVTVGVSGGIAAYKAAELVRALQRQALDVHVVMTEAAQKFITPLTFASLTGHKVITGLWPSSARLRGDLDSSIEHIGEAQTTEALVVAPATANVLAKFAHGLADDFLTTLFLATRAPVIVAPAMNVNMWEHPATRRNMEILEERGVRIVPPEKGRLGLWHDRERPAGRAGGHCRGRAGSAPSPQRSGWRDGFGDCRRNPGGHRPGSLSGQSFQRENGLCGGRGGAAPGGARGVGEWSLVAPSAGQL